MTEKRVPVQLEDGTVGTVPESELAQTVEAGGEQVSPEVLRKAQLEAKYGDTTGELEAFGAGAARGLTFGLSDAALTEFDPSLRDPLNALKEVNPTASTVGEVTGAVAPSLFTGGGAAVRGLGVIPRGAAALGGLAERGVAGIVGSEAASLGGRALQRGLALGARGAVEGGLYGAGHEVSEAALGDYNVTAEKLLAGAKQGALTGLVIGGGLGALEGAGSAAIDRFRTRLSDLKATKAAEAPVVRSEPGALTSQADENAHLVTGKQEIVPPSIVEKYSGQFENAQDLANAWKNRAKLFASHDDTVQHATRAVSDELSTAVKAERAVDMASFGEAKATQMAKLVPDADMAARVSQREAAQEALARVKATLDELRATPTQGGVEVGLKKLGKWVAQTEQRMDSGSAGDVFIALDDLKRAVGKQAGFGRTPFGLSEGAREFRSLYEDLRTTLENESVWGKAGAAQREINVATETRLKTRDLFQQRFLQQYGSTAGNPEFVADPAKLHSFVSQLTDARNDLTHQALRDYVAGESKFLDAVEKHYSLTAADKANIAKARSAFRGVEANVDKTAKSVAEVNQAKRLMEEEKAHGIGGLLGLGVDVFTRPMHTISRLADIERTLQKVDAKIEKGVRVFFDKPQAPIPVSGAESIKGTYAKRVADVVNLAAAPERIAAGVAQRFGDLADHAPNVTAAAASLESKKVAFLQSKIPTGQRVTNVLQPQIAKPQVSDQEMAKFMRYARAADDPLSVVKDLEHGKVSREGVETLKELYPSVYEQIRTQITSQLTSTNKPVPYAKQVQLGILFEIPAHPSLEPGFIAAMQEQWGSKPQQQGPGGTPPPTRPLQLPKATPASPVERIEGR